MSLGRQKNQFAYQRKTSFPGITFTRNEQKKNEKEKEKEKTLYNCN